MDEKKYLEKASKYLDTLCSVKPTRRTGSAGNHDATSFFVSIVKQFGYGIDTTPFDCLDFTSGEATLNAKGKNFDINISPYSLECHITAPLEIVTTVEDLENCFCEDKILLMKGKICIEQLMPKNFIFYNPEHHKKIYSLLAEKKPAAIITATTKNPGLAGALYPFPLIEDGDFDIPSVYCKDIVGEEIAASEGEIFELNSQAKRIPTTAFNVLAVKNPEAEKKIIICAHIDAYGNSPGALDNASGTVTLLLLAEMMKNYNGPYRIEILAFNGEDNYSAGGEMDYLSRYGDEVDNIMVICNIDGVGYIKGKISFSLYEFPKKLSEQTRSIFERFDDIIEGDQWYSGDHMIFVQKRIPAIAITAENMPELIAEITHTAKDTPEIIDCEKLLELASALKTLIYEYE
jgi:aminopeptidase YwaD